MNQLRETSLKEWDSLKNRDTVLIESLGNRVGGIGRPEGSPAVFVRGALPGEQVTIQNIRERKNFIEADLFSIEKPSPDRVKPFCKYYGICGGCSLQHLSYSGQLHWKRLWVEKAMRNLPIPDIDSTVPSPLTEGYRNKVTFGIRDNNLTLNAFKGDPVPVDSCPLMNDSCKSAMQSFLKTGFPDGITKLAVRGSAKTDSSIVELSGNYQDTIPVGWPPVAIRKEGQWYSLKPGKMFEKIGKLSYQIPYGGFFQVNTLAAEQLVSIVLNHIPENTESILDLYGGVGTFGLPLAADGFEVTTVEMTGEASEGCRAAAELNSIPRGRLNIINAKDSSFLTKALRKKKHFDVVITDPPRAGMGLSVSGQLKQLNPALIIYVSCNPFSAARDIALLTDGNYSIKQITPVDMFPHTDHVETVFLLERGKQ